MEGSSCHLIWGTTAVFLRRNKGTTETYCHVRHGAKIWTQYSWRHSRSDSMQPRTRSWVCLKIYIIFGTNKMEIIVCLQWLSISCCEICWNQYCQSVKTRFFIISHKMCFIFLPKITVNSHAITSIYCLIVSILPYHIFLFSPFLPEVFTYRPGNMIHILNWCRNASFWNFFPSKENSNSTTAFLISIFLYCQRVTFYASFFNLISMLITCSVINGSTGWKLTHISSLR